LKKKPVSLGSVKGGRAATLVGMLPAETGGKPRACSDQGLLLLKGVENLSPRWTLKEKIAFQMEVFTLKSIFTKLVSVL